MEVNTMKVRPIKTYNDLVLKRMVTPNDPPFEVSEERAAELTTANNKAGYPLCEIVEEEGTTPDESTAPDLETDAPIDSDFPDTEIVAPLSEELAKDAETADVNEAEPIEPAESEAAPKAKSRKKKED